MKNFEYYIETHVYFGEGEIKHLGEEVEKLGKSALVIYCDKYIFDLGIYSSLKSQFKLKDIKLVEFSDIEPNPRISSVRKGIEICRENAVDVIVAIGGGSVIDCAKVIAASADYDGDAWDIVLDGSKIKKVIPLICISTISATGSEMDSGAVITNSDTNEKLAVVHPDMRPKCTILDPAYTFGLPTVQSASGTADIISHIFECYFGRKNAYMLDRVSEALLKTCFKYGDVIIDNPKNYEARANLMWASEWAINGFLSMGSEPTAWSIHSMQHPIGGFYNIIHGMGLAVLIPHWMRYVLGDRTVDKFAEYGKNVWDIDNKYDKYIIANEAVTKTEQFFTERLGIPKTLRELGVSEKKYFESMAKMAIEGGLEFAFVPLTVEDVIKIYNMAY